MPSTLTLVIYVLAVSRLTTIITTDQISQPFRRWLVARFDPAHWWHRWVVYLLGDAEDGTANGCPWCVSVWVAAFTAPIVYWYQYSPYVLIPMLALTASQITGMIHNVGRS